MAGAVFGVIKELGKKSTLLMIEQNPMLALSVFSRTVSMDLGVVRFAGTPDDLVANKSLRSLYLSVR